MRAAAVLFAAGGMTRIDAPEWAALIRTHLRYGRDRAIPISQLAEDCRTSRRTVERAIEELRASGAPVCTGADGVWMTDSAAELREQYRALRRRYIRQAVNARVLLATARRFERVQQMEMFG